MSAFQVPEHVPHRGVKNGRALLVVISSECIGKAGMQQELVWSAGVQDNLEGIHALSQLMFTIWQKMSGVLLSLCLE